MALALRNILDFLQRDFRGAIYVGLLSVTIASAQAQTTAPSGKKIVFVDLDDISIPILIADPNAGIGNGWTGSSDGASTPEADWAAVLGSTGSTSAGVSIASTFLYQPGTGRLYAWRFGNNLPRMYTLDIDGRIEKIDTPSKQTMSIKYFNTDTVERIIESATP